MTSVPFNNWALNRYVLRVYPGFECETRTASDIQSRVCCDLNGIVDGIKMQTCCNFAWNVGWIAGGCGLKAILCVIWRVVKRPPAHESRRRLDAG